MSAKRRTGIGVATRETGGAVAGNYYRRLTGKRRLGAPLGEANCRQQRDTGAGTLLRKAGSWIPASFDESNRSCNELDRTIANCPFALLGACLYETLSSPRVFSISWIAPRAPPRERKRERERERGRERSISLLEIAEIKSPPLLSRCS